MSQLCLCDSALEYSSRCQRYLSGTELVPDPSQLMHSRYDMFVMKGAGYLIKTWHPFCQTQTFCAELEKGLSQTEWLGLTLFASDEGRVPNKGFVSFVARFNDNSRPDTIIERSRFLKGNGQWYYIDGT